MSTGAIKKIFAAFSIALCASFNARALEWPAGMHTSKSVTQAALRGLSVYFENLQTFYAREWRGDDALAFYSGREKILSANLVHVSHGPSRRVDMAVFRTQAGARRTIVLERAGGARDIDLREFLSFKFLAGMKDFRLNFKEWRFSISSRSMPGWQETIYEKAPGDTKVVLLEETSPSKLYSELYYMCDDCGMDPLIAFFRKMGPVVMESYRIGPVGREVGSYEFFSAAKAYYLGWLFRKGDEFVSQAVGQDGWPKVD